MADEPSLEPSPVTAVDAIMRAYVEAAGGDAPSALKAAVSDLLDVQAEAELRKLALDQWVSRGYVRGSAIEQLERLR